MGKVYTREELEGIRCRVLIQAKAFYESQGRMPSIRELLDITGVTQHAIYKVFGGKAGIEDALNEGSTREEELPKELKEKRAAMIDCTKEFCKTGQSNKRDWQPVNLPQNNNHRLSGLCESENLQ